MSKQVQTRRGTTAEIDIFTGADGELTVDTDKKTIVVHDGATQGGTPLAKEDLSNVSNANVARAINRSGVELGGTGGGLTAEQSRGLIADWAEQGNDDKIPLIKLTLSSTAEALAGVSLTALMTPLTTRSAMNAFVEPWAQVDNDEEIPASKIGDGTLTAAKFAAGTLLRGQRGLTGQRGAKGDTGDAGSGTGGGLTTTAVRGLINPNYG